MGFSWPRFWERKSGTLAEPDAALLELFGATPALSGIAITPRSAMTCAPVRCAVQAISEAAGQLPVHVYRRGDDGSKQRDPQNPAYVLLHDQANDWTPASEFREQLTRDALLHGNGYAFINRVGGKVQELLRLNPERMTVKADSTSGEPVYSISEAAGQRIIPRENILHIRAPGFDGICGVSPVTQCREAIALALVMERHAARLFGKGARPSGVLAAKEIKTADALAKLKAVFKSQHSGDNAGDTAVLPADVTWQAITFNSVDSQFLELRQLQIAEIARVFRVPPILLQDYGRATWSNAEAMGEQFLTYCLLPWIKRWEGETRLKLFTPDERNAFFAEFLIDDLLRANFATRMDGYSKAIAARILSPNEARAAENRGPYDGGDKFENPNTTSVTISGPAPKREAE